jgi:hypothetical protein
VTHPTRTHRIFLVTSLALALVATAACDKSKEYAKLNARLAGYIQVGIELVDRQTSAGQMSAGTGLAVVNALSAVNTINGELIAESKKYLSPDGSKLVFDPAGKAKVLQIIESGETVLANLLSSEAFGSIPADKRKEWLDLIQNLTLTLDTLGEVVRAAKEAK